MAQSPPNSDDPSDRTKRKEIFELKMRMREIVYLRHAIGFSPQFTSVLGLHAVVSIAPVSNSSVKCSYWSWEFAPDFGFAHPKSIENVSNCVAVPPKYPCTKLINLISRSTREEIFSRKFPANDTQPSTTTTPCRIQWRYIPLIATETFPRTVVGCEKMIVVFEVTTTEPENTQIDPLQIEFGVGGAPTQPKGGIGAKRGGFIGGACGQRSEWHGESKESELKWGNGPNSEASKEGGWMNRIVRVTNASRVHKQCQARIASCLVQNLGVGVVVMRTVNCTTFSCKIRMG